jgi:hypothetical protein
MPPRYSTLQVMPCLFCRSCDFPDAPFLPDNCIRSGDATPLYRHGHLSARQDTYKYHGYVSIGPTVYPLPDVEAERKAKLNEAARRRYAAKKRGRVEAVVQLHPVTESPGPIATGAPSLPFALHTSRAFMFVSCSARRFGRNLLACAAVMCI